MEPSSVDELRDAVARGQSFKYVFFWGHTPGSAPIGSWVFSQWYEAPFTLGGVTYPTAEHYMMAQKALLFGDEGAASKILAARTPGEAKALGRGVQGFDEETWASRRFDVVTEGNVAKFGQNPELRAYLLGTGDRVLAEASPTDKVWGIGLVADDPGATDPHRWSGQNLLGFALMKARSRLRS